MEIVEKRDRVVYYDLETTGLGFHNKHKDIEIVEIGAVDGETKQTFKQFILPPSNHIPSDASNVHGLYLREGFLYRNDEKLEAVDLKTGLTNFCIWLKRFGEPITLAGYNSHNFDDWVICHNFLREGVSAVNGGIVRFLDVSKIVRPYLRSTFGHKKWNLTFAVRTCLGRDQSDAHTAVSDAVDTLDLMVKLAGEEVPEKAHKDACFIELMCDRLAKGLSIEEPKTKSKKTEVVDKKQPRIEAFFKVAVKEKKVGIETETVTAEELNETTENREPNIPYSKVVKRKENVLKQVSDVVQCSRNTRSRKRKLSSNVIESNSKKQRLPRAARAPRAPRKPRSRGFRD